MSVTHLLYNQALASSLQTPRISVKLACKQASKWSIGEREKSVSGRARSGIEFGSRIFLFALSPTEGPVHGESQTHCNSFVFNKVGLDLHTIQLYLLTLTYPESTVTPGKNRKLLLNVIIGL